MKLQDTRDIPLRSRLTVRLTGGVTLVLLLIGIPFLFAFHRILRNQQIDALAEATDAVHRVVVGGLRSAMLAGQPHLLDQVVRDLSQQAEVERVLLLDHDGNVRVSSDPALEGMVLDRQQDMTCRVCHGKGDAPPASRTAVTPEGERRVLRAMSTIPNGPACHACHDAERPTNGILLMDLALGPADSRFFTNIGSTVGLGAVMVVLTIAVLAMLLRTMVHRPLGNVVSTSQRIVQGDLDARASVSGPGEFALLASQVNRMTDHLARSLRTVETQRRQLQAILDAVDDEIVVLDRKQRVVAANRAFQRSRGIVEADLTGRPCREVSASHWPCATDQPGGCPVERVFETGGLHKGIMSRSDPDGKERTIEIHASPLRTGDGVVSQAVEVRRDISERRQMEASLAHSEHLASLGLLASGLSHEINNPLGAIATSVEGLRRRLAGEPGISPETAESLERALVRIAGEVERGRVITHRLLRVARPPGATRSLVDVNQVVDDILGILSHDIKRGKIAVSTDLQRDLPPLRGNESRVGQILMNLTLNAIQAMGENGGELRMTTSASDSQLCIEVRDTGCGIAPEIRKRIFEPFFTTKPVGKGTGLGLFITHRMVTEMEGAIRVRSEPGRGTRFTVLLPTTGGGDPS